MANNQEEQDRRRQWEAEKEFRDRRNSDEDNYDRDYWRHG